MPRSGEGARVKVQISPVVKNGEYAARGGASPLSYFYPLSARGERARG